MERRRRSLLAFLLTIVMVIAEGTTAFAAYPAGVVEEKEPEILGETGYGFVGNYEYMVKGDLLYGYYNTVDYSYLPGWTVTDCEGRTLTDYTLSYNSIKYNGKSYSYLGDAYIAGLKPGDKIDIDVVLSVKKDQASLISPSQAGSYDIYEGTVYGVEVKKGKITKDNLRPGYLYYISEAGVSDIENRKLPWQIYNYDFCAPYLILTDKGAEKLKDLEDMDKRVLDAYEDFNVKIERYSTYNKHSSVDVTDYFDIDLTGATASFTFFDSWELYTEVDEIQMGITASEFKKILKDNLRFLMSGKVQESWTPSSFKLKYMELKYMDYYTESENYVNIDPDDDKAIEEALSKEGNNIYIEASVTGHVEGHGEVDMECSRRIIVHKNSYRLVLEPFKEVASATGASYDRTKHDFMANVYALKNETEKIRVGSLGDDERFRLNVFGESNECPLRGEEKELFFENIRPGDKMHFNFRWYIPSDGRYLKYQSAEWDYWPGWNGYRKCFESPLEFFEYGSGGEYADPAQDHVPGPLADPYADVHKTEAYDMGTLSTDAAPMNLML